MRARFLFLLEMTDEGARLAPSYEINEAMIVVARTPREAREFARWKAIDESPMTWTDSALSKCSRLGLARETLKLGVLMRENNAS